LHSPLFKVIVIVTDGVEEMCGPWGKGSHLGSQGSQKARPARRGKRWAVGIRQWRRIDITGCLKTWETGSPQHQATFMHRVCIVGHCILITTSTTKTGIMFQENKSFGSKKPFAFILWCTGSCVKHSYIEKLKKKIC
jgi:hypothetical protein